MDIISQVQVSGSIYDIGGGHIIVNGSGTNLTRRASLQFNNATIVDDPTNNKTIVSPYKVTGSDIIITTSETSLYGKTITITNGTITETTVFNNNGEASFDGYTGTGWVTLTCSNGTKTAYGYINIPYYGRFEVEISFWTSTINLKTNSFYGKNIYVSSPVAPSSTLAFDNNGEATYIAKSPGAYTFSVYI